MMDRILKNPTKVFLIDAVGAFLTAITLGIVFTSVQEFIGMPKELLISLAIVASLFFIYSASCFFKPQKNWRTFLGVIATANLMYCLLTSFLIITYFDQLTIVGILYFVGEITLIVLLVYFEVFIIRKEDQHKKSQLENN
ncbi:hypothetical protein [Marivirga harenae]|uniref:hypothetical protein n=1 Tax=Marivirga harenae TaxID=2010992 RepID=UPI0026DF73C0|nr:hypothetical protein [Marivirga harenae]WKV13600.1 hypothetical protein Q3Y49_07135 [Marivirga harenae]|tara:strand:+ start:240156 stop:240575 length:420 start_codon:yes stop_codon:yes gene_type:complete